MPVQPKTERIIQIGLIVATIVFLALSITFIILFATKHDDSSSFLMSAVSNAKSKADAQNEINAALSNQFHVNSLQVDQSGTVVTAVFSLRGTQTIQDVQSVFKNNKMFTDTQITDGSKSSDVCHMTPAVTTAGPQSTAKQNGASQSSKMTTMEPSSSTEAPSTTYCSVQLEKDVIIVVDLLDTPADTENKTQQLEIIGNKLSIGIDFAVTRVFLMGMDKQGHHNISTSFATSVEAFQKDWEILYSAKGVGESKNSVNVEDVFVEIKALSTSLPFRSVPIEVIVLTSHSTSSPLKADLRTMGAFVAVIKTTGVDITGWDKTGSHVVSTTSWSDAAQKDPISTLICQYFSTLVPTPAVQMMEEFEIFADTNGPDNTCQKLDILFVIDTSQSVVPQYVDEYKSLAANLSGLFTLSGARDGDNSNIGLLQFSDDVTVVLPLGQHSDTDFNNALKTVAYTGGKTDMRKVLAAAQSQLKTLGNKGHGQIVYFLTDGAPTVGTLTDCVGLGKTMTDQGIDIFFVGDAGYDADTAKQLAAINGRASWVFSNSSQAMISLPTIALQQFPCPGCEMAYFAIEASEVTQESGLLYKGLQIVSDTAATIAATKNKTAFQLVFYNTQAQYPNPAGYTLEKLNQRLDSYLKNHTELTAFIGGHVRLDSALDDLATDILARQDKIPIFQSTVLIIGEANTVTLDPLAESEEDKRKQLVAASKKLSGVNKLLYAIDGSRDSALYGDDLWPSVISQKANIINSTNTDIQQALTDAKFFSKFAELKCALPKVENCDQTFVDVTVAIDVVGDDAKITAYLCRLLTHFGTTYTAHFSFIAFGSGRDASVIQPLGAYDQGQCNKTMDKYADWRKLPVAAGTTQMTPDVLTGMFDQVHSQFGCTQYNDDKDRVMATNVLLIVSDNFATYTNSWATIDEERGKEWSCSDCPGKPNVLYLSTTLDRAPANDGYTYQLTDVDYDFTRPAANNYLTEVVGGVCESVLPVCCSYVPNSICQVTNQFWKL